MSGLTSTIQEILESKREEEWRRMGISEPDITFSALTGMDARDVRAFREFSRRGLILVVRCPKAEARIWHGVFPPKHMGIKAKTGSSGLIDYNNKVYVSDYDLMSLWRRGVTGWEKVFVSAAKGADRGSLTTEARALIVALNRNLVSRVQHGCQDDYLSPKNRGLKADDTFGAFHEGSGVYLQNPMACAAFYARFGLAWPYDGAGNFVA